MSENPIIGMKEQQRRRARINRMKMTIIFSIFGWMLISMIVCVALGVKVISLDKRVDKLYNFVVSESQNNLNNNSTTPNPDTEGDMEPVIGDNPNIQFDTDISNIADENSVHKVYLTFDDGPSDNTDDILDVLAAYDVKATFFVVGRTDEHSLNMYRRIIEEGHSIGIHSYTHKYSVIYSSIEAFEADLEQIRSLILETTGVDTKLLRFPGGSSNQVSEIDMLNFINLVTEKGYTYYDWNVVSGDATVKSYTEQDLVDNVINGVKKYQTSIVLMHDATNKDSTVAALSTIIEELLNMNAQILPINEETVVIQHVTQDAED